MSVSVIIDRGGYRILSREGCSIVGTPVYENNEPKERSNLVSDILQVLSREGCNPLYQRKKTFC